jgi:hypothetical protein
MKNIELYKSIVLLLILPITIWFLGINKTMQLSYRIKSLHEEANVIKKADSIIQPIFQNVGNKHNEVISNGGIINIINPLLLKYNIELKKYTPYIIDKSADYKLYTGELLLSGRYIDLLNVIKEIEDNKYYYLKLISANFSISTNTTDNLEYLQLAMYIMQLE